MTTQYERGQRFAYKVRDDLQDNGYLTGTMAGSKGAADIWAIKPGQVLFVQVKKTDGQISPKERAHLYDDAARCRGGSWEVLPIVAYQPVPRKPIVYRLLTGTASSEWELFHLDEIEANA